MLSSVCGGVDVSVGDVYDSLGVLMHEYRRYGASLRAYLDVYKRHNDEMKVCVRV